MKGGDPHVTVCSHAARVKRVTVTPCQGQGSYVKLEDSGAPGCGPWVQQVVSVCPKTIVF